MSLIRNQTSIIDATVGVIKTSHKDVTNRFDVISRQIETLKNTVDKNSVVIQLNSLIITTTLVMSKFRETQNSVIELLQNIWHSNVNSLVMTPKQLTSQLEIIQKNLPPHLVLPIRIS